MFIQLDLVNGMNIGMYYFRVYVPTELYGIFYVTDSE